MCRLFGLHADGSVVTATFWLLDAPDSLAAQSKKNPDGTGLGVFGRDGAPEVRKQSIAAWQDTDFACEAHEMSGTTFIAHVRYASTGNLDVANTHPFLQDDRLFAHNGVVTGLDVLDERLAELSVSELVRGETDSERVFALITGCVRQYGDLEGGLVEAMMWLATNVPIYAANLLLTTASDMLALRYPETHELYMLERRLGSKDFEMQTHRIHARSRHLDQRASVVFASEPMDDDSSWRLLEPGVLVHVDAALSITQREILPEPPMHQLTLSDLSSKEAASQHPHGH